MAIKRALVVDDSRSARIALKNLLGEHELDVVLAGSGEEALEYLGKADVDVIFMDHTMPGMDGLEAVSAIKANPNTATIPVMMYTTKEGEVYVGQARALGAVGVLPKNVQPHQLFEMLRNLGLVKERRGVDTEARVEVEPEPTAGIDEIDRVLEEQALGMSVQTLVQRILEDQHHVLRADILRGQKAFAQDVAHEILMQRTMPPDDDDSEDSDLESVVPRATLKPLAHPVLAAAAAIALVVSSFLAWQFKAERDSALDQLVALEASRTVRTDTQLLRLQDELDGVQAQSQDLLGRALDGFEWAANLDNGGDMYDAAFDPQVADRIRGLLPHLRELGFVGDIEVTSHLGKFCLMVDETGNYQLAADDLPMLSCDYIGHVLENSAYVSDRLSVEFSQLLRDMADAEQRLKLTALDVPGSQDIFQYPGTSATAGEWNQAAMVNNRVQVEFLCC